MEGNHFSESLEDCSRYYDGVTELLDRWGPLMGDRFVEVVYEAFVDDPVQGMDRVFDRLSLAGEPGCYDPSASARVVKTASQFQVTKPVYTDANRNWAHYRDLVEAPGAA